MRQALPLVLLLTQAVAQDEPGRARLIGSVHGANGSAWVGATVTLHGMPTVPLPEFGKAETLQVQTDDRGRFRVSLRRGRSYSVWAVRGGDDGFAVTAIARNVRPAQPLMLREATKTMPVRVRVLGLAAWKKVGTPGLFVRDALGRRSALELDDNGEANLGPLGGESCYVEVCDARAHLLYRQRVQLSPGARKRDLDRFDAYKKSRKGKPMRGLPDLLAQDAPAIDLERVLLGPPLRCRMRFVGEADNKPVPRVEVLLDVHYDARRAPRFATRLGIEPAHVYADDKGRAEFVVPTPISRWGRLSTTTQVLFIGKARGFQLKQHGWAKSRKGATRVTEKELIAGVTDEITVKMRKGYVMRGRVIGTAELPATAVSIVCKLPGHEESGKNSFWGFHTFEVARPNARGEWVIHGVGRRSRNLRASLVLPPAIIAKLGPSAGVPMSPILTLGQPTGGNLGDLAGDVRCDAIELARLRITELAVAAPDGGPARLARVQVHRTKWTTQRHGLIHRLGYIHDPFGRLADAFTDRRGRCRIITTTDPAFVLIEGAQHYAFKKLEFASNVAAPAPRKILLKPYGSDYRAPRGRRFGPGK